ncbi:hypothetical protein Ancab_000002 [Ancistrocladus abbreviatus]
MMLFSSLKTRIQSWLRDYDKLQSFAVILIYVQIGCALVGSLGASYNGVLLINLAIALFALVAIESGSQSLGRTYAILLFFAILLDITWFILFSYEIWILGKMVNRLVEAWFAVNLFSESSAWIHKKYKVLYCIGGLVPCLLDDKMRTFCVRY